MMAITDAFKSAVSAGDINGMRIIMKECLLTDRTFNEFDELDNFARSVDGLYEAHDGRELNKDKSAWNEDYLKKLTVQVIENFSQESIRHLKEVVRHLHPTNDLQIASDSQIANDSQPAGDSQIANDSQPADDSQIANDSQPAGDSQITNDSQPADDSQITNDSQPADDSQIAGNSQIANDSQPADDSQIAGNSQPANDSQIANTKPPHNPKETDRTEIIQTQLARPIYHTRDNIYQRQNHRNGIIASKRNMKIAAGAAAGAAVGALIVWIAGDSVFAGALVSAVIAGVGMAIALYRN